MKNNKILIITTVVVVLFFVAVAIFMPKEQKPDIRRVSAEKLVKPHSPTMGNPDAKVTIVEFLDPECEACAAFYPKMKGLINDYKDQVRFVVRYMLFHGNSRLAAIANEAAGRQGKYWEMQGQLFFRKDWTHQQEPQTEKFEAIAKELGLDIKKFREDMKDPAIATAVESDFQEGPSLGVQGTPTIFVNGRMLESLSYASLKALVDEELQASK